MIRSVTPALGAAPHAALYPAAHLVTRELTILGHNRGILTLLYDLDGARGANQYGMLATRARSLLRFGIDAFLARVHLQEHTQELEHAQEAMRPLLRARCLAEIFGNDSAVQATAWELETRVPVPGPGCEAYLDEVWEFLEEHCGLERPADLSAALADLDAHWAQVVEVLQSDPLADFRSSATFDGLAPGLFTASVIGGESLAPLLSARSIAGDSAPDAAPGPG